MLVADIIIEQTAFSFDKPYGYAIPQDLAETLKPGCRVVVPFGKGNTHRQGMVIGIYADETNPPYKEIIRTIALYLDARTLFLHLFRSGKGGTSHWCQL